MRIQFLRFVRGSTGKQKNRSLSSRNDVRELLSFEAMSLCCIDACCEETSFEVAQSARFRQIGTAPRPAIIIYFPKGGFTNHVRTLPTCTILLPGTQNN